MGPTMSVYASSKLLGERLGALYSDQHGFQFIALRYSLTFGPGVIRSPGIAKAFQDLQDTINGSAVTIADFSGDSRQQITYVRDAAAGTVLALLHDRPSYRVYNVAGPYENFIAMSEFHDILKKTVPETGAATFTGPRRAGGPCDITRIQDDLGFKPRYTVADGIRAKIKICAGGAKSSLFASSFLS
jgi:nucleoside-diphosphate-sugar epimerase